MCFIITPTLRFDELHNAQDSHVYSAYQVYVRVTLWLGQPLQLSG